MRKLLLAVLCLTLGVAAWAAGPDRNNLIIGTNQEPNQFNPWEGAADTKENVMGLLYIGFSYFDSNGELQPGLATEIPTERNGRVRIVREGGKFVRQEVDWTIRANAKWSDGTDITSADVTFTYEVQQNQLIPATFRTFSNRIQEIRVRDAKNFTIVYKEPNLFYASPTGRLGLARFYDIAPKHIWEPIFRAAVQEAQANPARAAEIIQQRFLGADPATGRDPSKVVGSGAFKFAEWQRNQFTRFTRRTDFFLAPPGEARNYVQEVIVRYFTATETLLQAILAGEIDASDDIGLAGQDPEVLKGQLGNRGSVQVSPSGFIEQLNINKFVSGSIPDTKSCPLADDLLLGDKRTRQAIIQALDRDAIKVVFPGGIVSNSFVVRGDLGFNDKLNAWPRNLEKARALLKELGWEQPTPADVLRRKTADGRTVFFQLPHVTTPATFRVRTQEILVRQLRDVGISLVPSTQPASVLFSTPFVSGSNCNWQGIIEFASAGGIGEVPADELSGELWADDPETPQPFDNIPRPANNFAGSNVTGWNNKAYDTLHFQALQEFDSGKRADIIKKMQEIFNDELPFIPLYERAEILTTKTGLVNYTKGTPLTRTPNWNAWEWGWEQNGARKVR